MLVFPHGPSRPAFEADYRRTLAFLQNAERIRDNELQSGDGRNFRVIATQWFRLAGLEYFHEQPWPKIAASTKSGLECAMLALELGFELTPAQTLHDVLTALAVGDSACVHFLMAAPPAALGFEDDPASEWMLLTKLLFCVLKNQKEDILLRSEFLQCWFAERPFPIERKRDRALAQGAFHMLSAIVENDETRWHARLDEWSELRLGDIDQKTSRDPAFLIDWLALGYSRLALDRGLGLGAEDVFRPIAILKETDARTAARGGN